MTPQQVLDLLNDLDEHHMVEAKSTRTCAGDAIFKSICAFANVDGGWVLCGVRRQPKLFGFEYVVDGVDETDKVQLEIQTGIAQFSRPIPVEITAGKIKQTPVILVRVPKVEPYPSHVFFAKLSYPRGVFLRRGSVDHQCDDGDIPFLTEITSRTRYEDCTVANANNDHFDQAQIREYRNKREAHEPLSEEHQLGERDFLESQNAITEVSGKTIPTVCGILLFGNHLAVSRFFPCARISYFRVPGVRFRPDPGQRDGDLSIHFEGSILKSVAGAMSQMLSDMFRHGSFDPESPLLRQELTTIENRIARESLVNAVTHRSYHESASTTIVRYANRVTIQNPGHSLMPIANLAAYKSRCRNQKLAAAFRRIGWAEALGSGIGTLRDRMNQKGLPEPVFDNDVSANFFTVFLILEPYDETEVMAWMHAIQPEFVTDVFSAKIMFFAREIQAINQSMVQSIELCGGDTATAALHKLCQEGFLTLHEFDNSTYYKLSKVAADLLSSATGQYCGKSEVLRVKSEVTRVKCEVEESKSEVLEQKSEVRLFASPEDAEGEEEEVPEEVLLLLSRLKRRSSTNAQKELVKKAILALCEWKPMKLATLATQLDRSANSLYRDYVGPLTIDGELKLLYADSASHPGQKYVLTSEGAQWLMAAIDL